MEKRRIEQKIGMEWNRKGDGTSPGQTKGHAKREEGINEENRRGIKGQSKEDRKGHNK